MNEFINYCKKGDLNAAKDFFIRNPSTKISTNNYEAFVVACINGNIDIVQWLYSIKSSVINRSCNFSELVDDIIESGSKEVLVIIKNIKNIEFSNKNFVDACKFGWFNIVKLIYFSKNDNDNLYNFNEAFSFACENGHILIAKWLLEKKSNINISAFSEYAFRKACENGHYEIAKWLYNLGLNNDVKINISELNNYAIIYATIYGHIEIVKWLNSIYIINKLHDNHTQKLELFNKLFNNACVNGHFDLVKWLYNECGKKVNILKAFSNAFSNGHIEIVDWLYSLAVEMKGPLTVDLIENAEKCGKKVCPKGGIEVMRWLYKIRNYSWYHIDYFKLAAVNGHYKLAKWLYSINKDVRISENDEEIFCICCEKGYEDIVEWLLKVKPTINININDNYSFIIACENGHLNIAKFLYNFNNGYGIELKSFLYAFVLSLVEKHIKIAKWIYSIKPEIINLGEEEDCLKEIFERICCKVGNLELAKWLYTILPTSNLEIWCDNNFIGACKKEFVDIAEWLQSIKPEKYKLVVEFELIVDYDIIKALPMSGNTIALKNMDVCSVCYNDNNIVNLQTNCRHNFCTPCMTYYWKKNNICPYCRTLIEWFNKIE